MRPTAARPTGVEHKLGDDQIIVSKTDPKGLLTYVNDVFLEISRFDEKELIGQPHNIVRHPDMPRCVFKLVWDQLTSGHEIFGYVLNLSKDGGHYWILAHMTPSFDGSGQIVGYHSNRRAPSAYALERISPMYAELLAEEARHDRKQTAIEAGTALLEAKLAELGMNYDEFVWSLANHGTAREIAA